MKKELIGIILLFIFMFSGCGTKSRDDIGKNGVKQIDNHVVEEFEKFKDTGEAFVTLILDSKYDVLIKNETNIYLGGINEELSNNINRSIQNGEEVVIIEDGTVNERFFTNQIREIVDTNSILFDLLVDLEQQQIINYIYISNNNEILFSNNTEEVIYAYIIDESIDTNDHGQDVGGHWRLRELSGYLPS